ncbi:hypothetical protein EV182_006839, partial [Spiromyces aspiralis]
FNIEMLCKDGSYATLNCVCMNCHDIVIAITFPTDLPSAKLTRIGYDGQTKEEEWVTQADQDPEPAVVRNADYAQVFGAHAMFPRFERPDDIYYMPIPEHRACLILRSEPSPSEEALSNDGGGGGGGASGGVFGPSPPAREWVVEFASQSLDALINDDGSKVIGRPFLNSVYVEDLLDVAKALDAAMSTRRVISLRLRVCPNNPTCIDDGVPLEGLAAGSYRSIILLLKSRNRTRNDVRNMIEHRQRIKRRQRRGDASGTGGGDQAAVEDETDEDGDAGYFSLCDLISSDVETSSAAENMWLPFDDDELAQLPFDAVSRRTPPPS